jgi:hypothetical protein
VMIFPTLALALLGKREEPASAQPAAP